MKPFRTPKCTKCSNTRIISADKWDKQMCLWYNRACNDVTRAQITKSRARVGSQALICLRLHAASARDTSRNVQELDNSNVNKPAHFSGWSCLFKGYDISAMALHRQTRASCNKSVDMHLATNCYNKPISGCVRMACDSLWQQVCCKLTTGYLQIVNRLVASWLFQQACC